MVVLYLSSSSYELKPSTRNHLYPSVESALCTAIVLHTHATRTTAVRQLKYQSERVCCARGRRENNY